MVSINAVSKRRYALIFRVKAVKKVDYLTLNQRSYGFYQQLLSKQQRHVSNRPGGRSKCTSHNKV